MIATPHAHIVANPALPDLSDANHADAVTAESDAAIAAVTRTRCRVRWPD